MKIFFALRNRLVRRLWAALILSCIGAELYSFATVWIFTNRLGSNASYLVALRPAVILISTLTSGGLIASLSHKNAMLLADCVRFFATLLLFVQFQLTGSVSIPLFIGVIIVVSFCRPMFDPALQGVLAGVKRDRTLLQAVNGLFDMVRRVSRSIGPALAAVMFSLMSVYNFFLFDALTYMFSAISIISITLELKKFDSEFLFPALATSESFFRKNLENIVGGFRALKHHPTINYHLIAYAICTGGWYVSLVVGVALKMHLDFPGKSEYFGYIIGIYGVFNVLSNVVFSELSLKRPVLAMSAGRILSGIGLLFMALSNSLWEITVFAAIAAIGAPITQLQLATLMQTEFTPDTVVKVYRCRMFYEWLCYLIGLLAAPKLIQTFSLTFVQIIAALIYLVLGVIGIIVTREIVSHLRESSRVLK